MSTEMCSGLIYYYWLQLTQHFFLWNYLHHILDFLQEGFSLEHNSQLSVVCTRGAWNSRGMPTPTEGRTDVKVILMYLDDVSTYLSTHWKIALTKCCFSTENLWNPTSQCTMYLSKYLVTSKKKYGSLNFKSSWILDKYRTSFR